MEDCLNCAYNDFGPVDTATKSIVNYLIYNNEDLWKLLKYIEPNDLPLSKEDLRIEDKIAMICVDPYATNDNVDKNILFQTNTDEAFSTAIPQIRIEVGDIVPMDRTRGYMEINFQVIVPNRQDIFTAPYNNVARRTDAIFRELAKTLNGKDIPESGFQSKMFLDRNAPRSAGRGTGTYRQQMNNGYSGRWVTFAVLI